MNKKIFSILFTALIFSLDFFKVSEAKINPNEYKIAPF